MGGNNVQERMWSAGRVPARALQDLEPFLTVLHGQQQHVLPARWPRVSQVTPFENGREGGFE